MYYHYNHNIHSQYLSPPSPPSPLPQDVGTGMLVDLERLQAILKDLSTEVSHPAILPETTREILEVQNTLVHVAPIAWKYLLFPCYFSYVTCHLHCSFLGL